MSKAKIFCIANQKGGVGKTTTTVNLAAALAKIGQRVLMIDLDPQGNATTSSGLDRRSLVLNVYDILLGNANIEETRRQSPKLIAAKCNYDIIGANRDLAGAELDLVGMEHREHRLKMAVALVETAYDFVLIDCPPSLSLLTLNGLCCADGVIVPMQCEYFAMEGLSDLVASIKQIHANLNPHLQIIGLLRVMFDARITLQQEVSEQLKLHFDNKVFDAIIPRNVRLAEAPGYGLPGVAYDPSAKGSVAFVAFAKEMVARVGLLANPISLTQSVGSTSAALVHPVPAEHIKNQPANKPITKRRVNTKTNTKNTKNTTNTVVVNKTTAGNTNTNTAMDL